MSDTFTKETLDSLMASILRMPMVSDTILIGAEHYAGLKATIDYQGRDRRRIKREVRKAMRAARLKRFREDGARTPLEHPVAFQSRMFSFWTGVGQSMRIERPMDATKW